jgi:acyl-CoA dehydrogenase
MNVQHATFHNDAREESSFSSLRHRTAAVAEAAASAAEAVDHEACFPKKAIEAARRERLLGAQIPVEFGGDGASTTEIAEICFALGRSCASSGMIYAMHQTKIACLIRHGIGSRWHERLLRRIADEQLLMASSTTEGQNGGNIRFSSAAVERADQDRTISLSRDATVISYGAQADGIVTIARRDGDATGSDQVLLAIVKDHYTLEPTIGWQTLGMRGTCSAGFKLEFKGSAEQIFPEPYERIHVQTMTPMAHLYWSSVWAGNAAAAVERAQLFVRKAARNSGGQMPPAAAHFTQAKMSLARLRALIAVNLEAFARNEHDKRALASLDFQSQITLLKVQASELAVETVMHAMRTAGLAGYRNDGEFTMSRYLRDALSAPIMINNDRILANAAAAALVSAVPTSLRD